MGFVPDEQPSGRFVPDDAPQFKTGDSMPYTPPRPRSGIEHLAAGVLNVPSSAAKTGKRLVTGAYDIAKDAILHNPTVTLADTVAKRLAGETPREGSPLARQIERNRQMLPATRAALGERYGSWDNALRTLEADPVGVGMDAAGVLMGGGKLMSLGGATSLGGKVYAAGNAINPVTVAGKGIGVVGKMIPKTAYDDAAMWAMKKAVKPLPAYEPEVVDAALKTALREGGDVARLGGKTGRTISDTSATMSKAADGYAATMEAQGQTVSMRPALDNLRAYRAYIAKSSRTPERDLAAIDKYIGEVEALPEAMPPTQALAQRRLLNQKLAPIFRRHNTIGGSASETLSKEMMLKDRAGVQQGLFELMPELKSLGIKQAELIEYGKMAARRMNWAERSDIMGLPEWIVAASTGSPGMTLAARMVKLPQFLSRVAYKLAQKGTLATAGDSTLELLGMTREAAIKAQPVLKALPAAPTKLPSGRPDPSGLLKQDDVIPAVSNDVYDQAWAQYATVPPRNVAGLRDLQDVVPKGRPPGGLIEGWNGPVSLKTGAPPVSGTMGGAGQEIGQFGVPQRTNMAPINDWSESVGGFPARLERTVPDAQLAPSPIKTGVKPPKVTDWAADAEKANVKFMGMQDIGGGKSVPVFQDGNNVTGVGSFVAQPGETVAQALARAKKRYKETK